jgi:hypothetical protein
MNLAQMPLDTLLQLETELGEIEEALDVLCERLGAIQKHDDDAYLADIKEQTVNSADCLASYRSQTFTSELIRRTRAGTCPFPPT